MVRAEGEGNFFNYSDFPNRNREVGGGVLATPTPARIGFTQFYDEFNLGLPQEGETLVYSRFGIGGTPARIVSNDTGEELSPTRQAQRQVERAGNATGQGIFLVGESAGSFVSGVGDGLDIDTGGLQQTANNLALGIGIAGVAILGLGAYVLLKG